MTDDPLMDVLTRKRGTPPTRTAEPDETLLPDPSAGYQPYSRSIARPVYTLHLMLGREGVRSFQYVQLDSDSAFTADELGQCIRLRFCGSKILQVTIRGRNLRRLYDLIHQHRVAWVMRQDAGRDFTADGETMVTEIGMKEVSET